MDESQLIHELNHHFQSKIEHLNENNKDNSTSLMDLLDKMLDTYSGDGVDATEKYNETIKCLNKIRNCLIASTMVTSSMDKEKQDNDISSSSTSNGCNSSIKTSNKNGNVMNTNFMLKFDLNELDSGVSTPISPGQFSQNNMQ